MDRDVRKLHHNKQDVAVIKVGVPSNDELVEGVTQLRYVSGSGLFWYLKYNNTIYRQQFAGPNQQQVITTSISPDGEPSDVVSDHGELDGLTDDDHTQYLLIDGTRAMTGDLSLSGGDGALTFTVAGENSIKIPDNQASALIIEEANAAYLTFVTTNSGEKITLGKKLEAGSVEIEGSAFDINGGDIAAVTISGDNTWSSDQTGVSSLTLADGKNINLTTGNIVFTPSANDTITIAGATNGALSITTVDNAAAAANIQITADGTFEVDAKLITLDSVGDIVIDAAGNEIYFKNNTSLSHTFQTSTGHITMINSGQLDNSVSGRLHLTGIGNGVHIMNPPAFNTSDGMGHGDEVLTYDHFPLRWKSPTSGSYIGQHIAGGEADYKNNYTMIGFSTTSSKYANHAVDFVLTS